MLVDRTAADVASARKRNLCAFILAKQGANKIVGSSDPADVLVIHMDRMNPLRIDAESGEALLKGAPLDLSPIEYQLLEVLALAKGRLVSRDELLSKVWGFTVGDSRTVDVHIFRLRRKIEEDPEKPQLLHTVRGRGYRLLFKGDVPR